MRPGWSAPARKNRSFDSENRVTRGTDSVQCRVHMYGGTAMKPRCIMLMCAIVFHCCFIADAGGTAGPAHRGGADVHMTPDGRFLYATNRGPNSIAAYRLDPATGVMTFIAHYPTETMPRSFAIDPAGRFLYAGGQRSGRLAAYRIEAGTGRLTLLNSYQVGKNPVWVLVVQAADQGLD